MLNLKLCRTGVILAFVIFFLNALDGVATLMLSTHPTFYEVNPIMRYVLATLGEWMLVPKLAFGVIAGTVIAVWWAIRQNVHTIDMKVIRVFIVGIAILYFLIDVYQVVLLNIAQKL